MSSNDKVHVVVAEGDGIGPEITGEVQRILDAAGANIEWHTTLMGGQAFAAGHDDGFEPGIFDLVREYGVMLKAPMETKSGGGRPSLNVTMRRELGLWANIRPAVSYPYIVSPRGDMNETVFRENTQGMYVGLSKDMSEEDVGALRRMFPAFEGLGYQADGTVSFAVQIVSDEASQRIIRAAFDFAKANGGAEVHAMSKPNILKATDGRFKAAFEAVQQSYPSVESRFSILDAGFGNAIAYPVKRGVLVTQNLYGDVLSDTAAFQAHGSMGLAPSVNLGGDQANPIAMFEAVHGTAPDIAGQGKANPTALLLASVMMLRYSGQPGVALKIHDALMTTWEQEEATGDLVLKATGARGKLLTGGFADAVIANLGRSPETPIMPPVYMTDDLRAALPAPSN